MSNPQFFTRNDIHRLYRRIAKTTHVVLKCQFFRFSKIGLYLRFLLNSIVCFFAFFLKLNSSLRYFCDFKVSVILWKVNHFRKYNNLVCL